MSMTTPETWMEEARQQAAQCWRDDETQHIEMVSVLAEAVARRIAAWMDTAARHCRNEEYYRGLLEQCGNTIGLASRTCDDGSLCQDVLCCKIPELVAALCGEQKSGTKVG